MLKFLSICSGLEAASVALAPLGWEALAFAEIEPFPCAVLAHHYGASRPWHMPLESPNLKKKENKARAAAIKSVSKIPVTGRIPNLGDLTRWREWPAALLVQVQLLCGGTPCQAFSVAGLRESLADERGNLSLIFCELYAHINQLRRAAGLPPALLLWENVPGVLSTHDNAFGCFLAGLAGEVDALQPPGGKWAHAGYVSGPSASIAYRTLDAQYFGLAQRRKRVFVVASADPAFDPAAVLFEFTGLRRDTPPRRETGQTTAPTLSARAKGGGGLGTDADADCDGACIPEIVQSQDLTGTLSANGKAGPGLPMIAFSAKDHGADATADLAPTLRAGNHNTSHPNSGNWLAVAVPEARAYTLHGTREGTREVATPTDAAGTIREGTGSAIQNSSNTIVSQPLDTLWRVRRLTPEECEILQGFPLGYTLLPSKGGRLRKSTDLTETIAYLVALGLDEPTATLCAHSPDGPRYKALGNSWAVPCARWIGQRIALHLSQ